MAFEQPIGRLAMLWAAVAVFGVAWTGWALLQWLPDGALPVARPTDGWGAEVHVPVLAALFVPSILVARWAAQIDRLRGSTREPEETKELADQVTLPVLTSMAPLLGPLFCLRDASRLARGVSPLGGDRVRSGGQNWGSMRTLKVGSVRWPLLALYLVTAIGSHAVYVGAIMVRTGLS